MTGEIREVLPPSTGSAFRAISLLRPSLTDEATFVRVIDEVQRSEGYRLVGVFEPGETSAQAIAGFRTGHALALGHFLYIDDLSTIESARRRGHGRRLLDWLFTEARRLGCQQVHLDSGVGPHRADAHRLYLNAGMVIASHHFSRLIDR